MPSVGRTVALLLFIIPQVLGQVYAQTKTTVSVVTQSAQPASSESYEDDSAFKKAMLDVHNFYRKEHNATALAWNDTNAKFAQKWSDRCHFEHSVSLMRTHRPKVDMLTRRQQGGPTGENLSAGYNNATESVDAWGMERDQYNFKKGEFSKETGHFTQLVWKATTSVGCGRTECNDKNGDGAYGWFVVCEYYPAGNVVGSFKANVQEQVVGPKNGDFDGGIEGGASAIRGGGWAGLLSAVVILALS
jgi:hypothetical protein